MKQQNKIIILVVVIIVCFLLVFLFKFYYQNLRGIAPALKSLPKNISELLTNNDGATINETDSPLKIANSFFISIFAKDLSGPRVLAFDSVGNLWVSETNNGTVKVLETDGYKVTNMKEVLRGLRKPHGLAFDPKNSSILYLAEENKISKIKIITLDKLQSEKIVDLPIGGRHVTRSLVFDNQENLYVSIGSMCNVCSETNPEYGSIMKVNLATKKLEPLAIGLRNAVFMLYSTQDNNLWVAEMGRDLLGDELPPDEINKISLTASGIQNFGWPICYGKNIHDIEFDKNIYIRNPCQEPFEVSSFVDLQAHSAPLGLVFASSGLNWPKEYVNDLLVAFHGSWNRTSPTGYKIVRIVLDENRNYIGQEDFISGWLTKEGAIGRPVGMAFNKEGSLFISDDKAGVIYKVTYKE